MTQAEALEILKTGRNVFVTGAAGSGKTHLINSYIEYLKSHDIDVGITASTGIAATHMGGVTIHSWAGIGINPYLTEYDLEAMQEKAYLTSRFEKVKVLIIDEVSMLHHFRFDLVNQVLKAMKGNSEPFGGLQVVLCGDFFQLPPVSRFGEPQSQFIYKSEAWLEGKFTVCYLKEQFRQKDDVMISILNDIRGGNVSSKTHEHLKNRIDVRTIQDVATTKLFTHNIDVDGLNTTELKKLVSSEEAEYVMHTKGRENIVATLKKSCLAPETLRLKVGARVMCVKNNFDAGYVNGTLGTVISCRSGQDPQIRTIQGKVITIERASWKVEEDGKVKAEIMQYPLRLAWAITVHKSQGMSLDAVEVDLSKAFETGMGYVALSRVRTLEGLTVVGINARALHVNEEVLEFDDVLQEKSQKALNEFFEKSVDTITTMHTDFLEYAKPKKTKKEKLTTYQETALLLEQKLNMEDLVLMRGVTAETIISHIEVLLEDNPRLDIGYLKKEIPYPQFKKIQDAIEKYVEKEIKKRGDSDDEYENIEVKLSPIKNMVGASVSYRNIQLARALLGYAPKGKHKH